MIFVALVIALVLGFAVTRIDTVIPESRLKKQVRTTSNLIEMGFSMSAIEGKELALIFDTEKRIISLEYYVADEEDAEFIAEELYEGEEEKEELKPLITKEWDESLTLQEMEVETFDRDDQRDFIIFYPQGTSDGAKIIWSEASGMTQELVLWPLLGKITISDVNHDNVFR